MNKQHYEEFLKTLLGKRQIPLHGEIDRDCFEMVSRSLMYLNAKDPGAEIKLLIDSGGGNVGYGLAVYDAVVSSPAPVTGIVMGPAHSMAAVVLQGCTKRIATSNSNICVHNISTRVEISLTLVKDNVYAYGELDLEKMHRDLSKDAKKLQSICKIISLRSRLAPSVVIDMLNSGNVISAEDALELGLIDEVI